MSVKQPRHLKSLTHSIYKPSDEYSFVSDVGFRCISSGIQETTKGERKIVLRNGEFKRSYLSQTKETDNYRGISLSQIGAKVYNRCLLNRIRPVLDKVLRRNQNGFKPKRSTFVNVLKPRRIVEELKNHKKEAVKSFIDFRKAFDSIFRC